VGFAQLTKIRPFRITYKIFRRPTPTARGAWIMDELKEEEKGVPPAVVFPSTITTGRPTGVYAAPVIW